MGNICSALREGIDYFVHYMFSQYKPPSQGRYSILSENSVNSHDDRKSFLDFDESFPHNSEEDNAKKSGATLDESFSNRSEEDNSNKSGAIRGENSEHLGKSNLEIVKNVKTFQDILNGSFMDYNPKQSMNATAYENKLYTECKMQVKETSCKNLINSNQERLDDDGTSDASACEWNARNGELTTRCESNKAKRIDSGLEAENYAISVGQDDSMSSSIRQCGHSNGSSGTEHLKKATGDNKNCNYNFASYRKRKYGMVPTDEVFSFQKHAIDEFEKRSSLIDENFHKDKDGDINVKEACEVRKLSLSTMYSGCLYSVGENNENGEFFDYSQESQPLYVPIDTYERVKNDKLQSGGIVAFEELSKHLCVRNYYAENPIVYDGPSERVEIPQTSPVKLAEKEHTMLPRFCSGGGLVSDGQRKSSLPDIFPEKNPLLKTYAPQLGTRSSVSTGGLVHRQYDQQVILSDLVSRSRKYDYFLALQAKYFENIYRRENKGTPTSASAPDITVIGHASPKYRRDGIKTRKSRTF